MITYQFKKGNEKGGLPFILKNAFRKMPEGKGIEDLLFDA